MWPTAQQQRYACRECGRALPWGTPPYALMFCDDVCRERKELRAIVGGRCTCPRTWPICQGQTCGPHYDPPPAYREARS